jgi:hypothetical protein
MPPRARALRSAPWLSSDLSWIHLRTAPILLLLVRELGSACRTLARLAVFPSPSSFKLLRQFVEEDSGRRYRVHSWPYKASSSSNAFASFKSSVSKPSVNQP